MRQPYALVKLLLGGTFTTGISLDWKTQFAAAIIYDAVPTIAGSVMVPGVQTTYGVYAMYSFTSQNPFDTTLTIAEASAGSPVQVYVNDALISEVTAPGGVAVSLLSGANKVEIIRANSPLVVIPNGPLIDPTLKTGGWISSFGQGADPFTGAGGVDSHTGSTGGGIGPP